MTADQKTAAIALLQNWRNELMREATMNMIRRKYAKKHKEEKQA